MDEPLNPYRSPQPTKPSGPSGPAAELLSRSSKALLGLADSLQCVEIGNLIQMIATLGGVVVAAVAILHIQVSKDGAEAARLAGRYTLALYASSAATAVSWLMTLGGTLGCLTAPQPIRSARLLLTAVFASVGSALVVLGAYYGWLPWWTVPVSPALDFTAMVAFLLFLHQLAEFLGREELARRINRIYVGLLILVAATCGVLVWATAAMHAQLAAGAAAGTPDVFQVLMRGNKSVDTACILLFASLFPWLLLFVSYLHSLGQLRQEILTWALPGGRAR